MSLGHGAPSIVARNLVLNLDPANHRCLQPTATICTNLATGGLVTGASGSPGSGTHTPNPNNFPMRNDLNYGVFDFLNGKGMNVEEDLGSYSELTVEVWYYRSAGTTFYITDGRNNGGSWFLSNYSSNNITFTNAAKYNFDTSYSASNPDFINRWQHLAIMTDGNESTLYIDGTNRTLTSNSPFNTTLGKNYRIGTRYTTSGQWTGYMGPIRIYSSVLSSADVAKNFNAVRWRYGI